MTLVGHAGIVYCVFVRVQAVRVFSLKGMSSKLFGQDSPEQRESRLAALQQSITASEDAVLDKNQECRQGPLLRTDVRPCVRACVRAPLVWSARGSWDLKECRVPVLAPMFCLADYLYLVGLGLFLWTRIMNAGKS